MSAIYGFAGGSRPEKPIDTDLLAMSVSLRHRGPDEDTRWVDATDHVAFGFRFLRTAIGETSPGVLVNEDRSLMMVCDGHVFNAGTLRSHLRDRGHTFRHHHSCELLLHLYEDEGVSGWRSVDGQFALALWDTRAKRLVLGRDFLGVRPLYYRSDAEGIVFASEIKALLGRRDVPHAVDEAALADFLTFTSVPGPKTLFREIHKVPPGSAAARAVDGTIEVATYWDLLQDPIPESRDERFYVEHTRVLHSVSVARRDVAGRIGSLLSGGNDSSANASLLSRNRSRSLHTFTVGLADLEGDAKYNDVEYARRD